MDSSRDIFGTPSHRPPLRDQTSVHSEDPCDGSGASAVPYLKSYSSLRVSTKHGQHQTLLSNSPVTSCQRRVKGSKKNLSTADSGGGGGNNGRSESMVNFSKRLSILTGKEISFPSNGEEVERGYSSEVEIQRSSSPRCSIIDDGTERPPPVPGHQIHPHSSHNFIRIRERQVAPPPVPPHASPLPSRLSSPDMMMHAGGRMSARLTPQCKQSSLVSLDRRLMPNRGSSGNNSSQQFHPHANGVLMSPSLSGVSSSGHNDAVRRSALLRSASSTAAAVAAAALANGSTTSNGVCSSSEGPMIPVTCSTLGPNHQFHPSSNHSHSPSSQQLLLNQPVPRSLQVSPALTQRSLYAQHIFSQTDHVPSSPAFCTSSRGGILRGHGEKGGGGPLDFLRHHATSSRSSFSGASPSSSALKSATSEFSFVRPDSPLTLPYNKSRSFYGRPVSSGGSGVSGVLPAKVPFNNNNPPPLPPHHGSREASSSSQQQHHHVQLQQQQHPPPRPPLPKQVSLEESSTLFRCARVRAGGSKGEQPTPHLLTRAASVAGNGSSSTGMSSSTAASSSTSAAVSSGNTTIATTASSTSSSSGFSSSNGSSSSNHSSSCSTERGTGGNCGVRSSSTLLPESSSNTDSECSTSSSVRSSRSRSRSRSHSQAFEQTQQGQQPLSITELSLPESASSSLPESRKSSFEEECDDEQQDIRTVHPGTTDVVGDYDDCSPNRIPTSSSYTSSTDKRKARMNRILEQTTTQFPHDPSLE